MNSNEGPSNGKSFEPRIVGFLCNWCSYAGADQAGAAQRPIPANLNVIRVMCSGRVDPAFWQRLLHASIPKARYGGTHVEVDKTRQVLFEVERGRVALVVHVSTGATGNTPVGIWHVYRRVAGFDWVLYYPTYFLRGFAIHGYPDVPPYPASHGCVRVPMWIAQKLYAFDRFGYTVYVYT